MAEGVLGFFGGGEEDGPERKPAQEALTGSEAFAASLAAGHAGDDPHVAAAASEFLREQARLLREQTRVLAAEAPLRLHHLRCESQEGRIRRTGQLIRLAMQALVALVTGAAALVLLTLLRDALVSHAVVVDAFQAPPALAARGLTGEVVASGVLDALQRLQAATRATAAGLKTTSAWTSDVRIELPETGISIGEVDRLLRRRFGHDLHIGGDLVQAADGALALTVRGDGVPARTFDGGADQLDRLTSEAADYVYGQSQPSRFAVYLAQAGRFDDDIAFIRGAFARDADAALRAQLALDWGNAYDAKADFRQAAQKHRLAMALAPRNGKIWWAAWGNLGSELVLAGDEEAGWQASHALLDEGARAAPGQRPALRDFGNAAQVVLDLPLSLAALLDDKSFNGGAGAGLNADDPQIADVSAQMHDWTQAERYLASSDPADPVAGVEASLVQGYAALDRGDAAAAIPPLEAFYRAWLADPSLHEIYVDNACLLGFAYGLAGRLAEADAVFRRLGAWSRCVALHGEVLARVGDLAGAARIWDTGLAAVPDSPLVELHRGLFELDRGQLAAATADLAAASAKAPHFAEPLKGWGDALVRQGHAREALMRYDQALRAAPAWTGLREARAAAGRAGRP